MASFLSTFSIFLLVLFNGFFAIPIDEQYSSISPFEHSYNTESAFNTRAFPVIETSPLVDVEHQHMDYNISIPVYNSTEEQNLQSMRGLQEILNSSSLAFIQEQLATTDAYNSNEFVSSTFESTTDFHQHSERYQDEQFSSTIEPTTESLTHVLRGINMDFDNDTETEQLSTSERSTVEVEIAPKHAVKPKRKSEGKPEPKPKSGVEHEHEVEPKPEPEAEPEQPVKPKAKSGAARAVKSKPQSIPKAKSKVDSESEQHEDEPHPEHAEEKPMKGMESEDEVTPKRRPITPAYDETQTENSKEGSFPIAMFDQDALKNVSYPLNNVLVLDENNNLNVTDIPRRFSTSTMSNSEEAKLNQGEEPVHTEEKESNN